MKSVQNTYFNINISNNKGFASLYDEEKYLFTKIKFRVYWINKIKNICDVVHFVYPTLPQFPAKCGSGVPFFIYFGFMVICRKHNSLPNGLIQSSCPSTKELHCLGSDLDWWLSDWIFRSTAPLLNAHFNSFDCFVMKRNNLFPRWLQKM